MSSPDLKTALFDLLKPKADVPKRTRSLLDLLDEPDGWRQFLLTLGKRTFTDEFAVFHNEFWDWYWKLTKLRRDRRSLNKEILTFLAGWPRGGGKSAVVEWACITEGAMDLPGYVLYVSLTQNSANNHVSSIRKRLEGEDIAKYFPGLANPKIGRHGNQYGWRQDFLITESGWAIRPVGLDVAIRGFREGDLRPTIIVFDDIDSFELSLAEVEKNLNLIARSIIPSGTKDTIHLIAQNLIAEHSAVNRIYVGDSAILSDHYPSVYPAFENLEITTRINEVGKTVYELNLDELTPTWEAMDVEAARIFLNKSGPEAFMAEYQHDFTLDQSERVLPEYMDFPTHVISWSQFEEKNGSRYRPPRHWQCAMGADFGFTNQHLSAWSWITAGSEDSYLPYAHYCYRGLTFAGESINDQARRVLELMKYTDEHGNPVDEREQMMASVMSHEKLDERIVLNREFDFTFGTCQFKKESGVPQWRSLMRVDRLQPHPYHKDLERKLSDDECFKEGVPKGSYLIGRPNFFYVVEDEELQIPRTDAGLAVHRAQTREWKRRKVTLTGSGIMDAIPMKYQDDCVDSLRMCLSEEYISATPLTSDQKLRHALKEKLRTDNLDLPIGQDDFQGILMGRMMAVREIEKKQEQDLEQATAIALRLIQPPTFRRGSKRI